MTTTNFSLCMFLSACLRRAEQEKRELMNQYG